MKMVSDHFCLETLIGMEPTIQIHALEAHTEVGLYLLMFGVNIWCKLRPLVYVSNCFSHSCGLSPDYLQDYLCPYKLFHNVKCSVMLLLLILPWLWGLNLITTCGVGETDPFTVVV